MRKDADVEGYRYRVRDPVRVKELDETGYVRDRMMRTFPGNPVSYPHYFVTFPLDGSKEEPRWFPEDGIAFDENQWCIDEDFAQADRREPGSILVILVVLALIWVGFFVLYGMLTRLSTGG
jgi:hypothetical protein